MKIKDQKYERGSFKLWKSTLRDLRMIYALTGEHMIRIVDRLVKAELKSLQDK